MDSSRAGIPMWIDDWLRSLAESSQPTVLLGATGHMELSEEEEAVAARKIQERVLPLLSGAAPDAQVLLLTGLAPGADVLFGEVASQWLEHSARPFRRIGLLPVPAETLWDDWLTRVGDDERERIDAMRERFERGLESCDRLVRLWSAAEEPAWSSMLVRQRQYRRLAALLVEQCDLLVAIQRAGHSARPGGTSEVVAWREHSGVVPSELATGERRHYSGWPHGDRLLIVDPSGTRVVDAGAQTLLRRAREALRDGNYLLCYDFVDQAEQQGHGSQDMQYLKLLALANSGSTGLALRRFEELRPTLRDLGEDWLAFEGRLHKDLGFRGGAGAAHHFRRATQCYETTFRQTGGYFSAINAATCALLSGDVAQSRQWAQDVLAQVSDMSAGSEGDQYYLRVTEAEAALLLGDLARARHALTGANALMADNINARSRTLQQLRLVCKVKGLDPEALDALQLAPVVFLPPSRASAVGARPPVMEASYAYAGLSEPTELAAVENLVEQGARVHVVLAAPPEKMLKHWSRLHGTDAMLRLDRLLGRLHQTSVALGFLAHEDQWCDTYVGAMALGLSRLAARRLGCPWRALDVGGLSAELPVEDAQAPVVAATSDGFGRRFAAVIFADFAGFSRLSDEELPLFTSRFMQAIADRLAARRDDILQQRTWGDALLVVAGSVATAAAVACDVQDCLEEQRPLLGGDLGRLELRLAAHYAPVFKSIDPIDNEPTYFGTQLSFAARIEPVTPPGMIFVTEAFAAQLALEAAESFVVEYAGEIRLAKAYGQSRLFSVRRAPA